MKKNKIQTKEKSKKLQVLSCMLMLILAIGFNVQIFAQHPLSTLATGTVVNWYVIESKTSNKVLALEQKSATPGTQIWQYNIERSTAQQFQIVLCTGGYYEISAYNTGLLMSLKYNPATTSKGAFYSLIQDTRYVKPDKINIHPALGSVPDPTTLQRWTLIPVGTDGVTYIIQSVAFPTQVLQPTDNNSQSAIELTTKTSAANQQWSTLDPSDMSLAPLATQDEIAEFENIKNNQLGVGVLGGQTTKQFYYTTDPPIQNELVWKYRKIINLTQLENYGISYVNNAFQNSQGAILSTNVLLFPLAAWDFGAQVEANLLIDSYKALVDIYDYFTNTPDQLMEISDWYPVSGYKKTVCGKMKDTVNVCKQDFLHTKVTNDKDICFTLSPYSSFTAILTNPNSPNANKTYDHIEGEVRAQNPQDLIPTLPATPSNLQPVNPLFITMEKNDDVCFFGPWMEDNLEFDGSSVQDNNEIHPINQFWRKSASTGDFELIAIADRSGYFDINKNGQIEASGLNQKMRFYVAVQILYSSLNATGSNYIEYDVTGQNYDAQAVTLPTKTTTTSIAYKGKIRLEIIDNPISGQFVINTHSPVILEKVRTRPDGSIQGYLVIETNQINNPGGSINNIVHLVTH